MLLIMTNRHSHSTCHQHIQTSRESGFTIVELMGVVAILGILLMAAMGAFDLATERARVSECDNNIKTIEIAINRAAALYELPKSSINDAQVNQFITGGLASLSCSARKNPQHTYHVVNGVISPEHNHR